MGKKRIVAKTEEELIKEKEKVEQAVKKEIKKEVSFRLEKGKIFISPTYNNTLISLTDEKGNVLTQRSSGSIGFRGTKKGTAYAASQVANAIGFICKKLKIKEFEVYIKGIGAGRESALRTLANQGLDIVLIKDTTPIPHNGCRPPKVRRV